MKLSLYSSVAFKNPFGLAYAMNIASALGYDAVDVRGHSLDVPILEDRHINAVGYDMIGPESLDSYGIAQLKEQLSNFSLSLSGISCYNSLTVPDGELANKSIEKFREMIDFASEFDMPWVRMIGYSENPFKGVSSTRKEAKRLFAERVRVMCEYGAEKNVGILLENGENSIPSSSAETLELAERISHSNLGIVFDVLNAAFEGLNPMEELKKLRGLLACVHVKNARMGRPSGDDYAPKADTGFRWTLLTEGDIDYKLIMEELTYQEFDGLIVCEYANPYKGMSRAFWDSMPDPQVWAQDARDFLRAWQ